MTSPLTKCSITVDKSSTTSTFRSRARLTEAMTRGMTDLGATIADAQLGNRVALAATMLEGKGVTEAQPLSTAAGEIAALAAELLKASR